MTEKRPSVEKKPPLVVSKPALLVYTFAKRVSLPEEGRNYLQDLWKTCESLGITATVPDLDIASEFPTDFGEPNAKFEVLASRINPALRHHGAYYQAFLYGYQDVVGLIVCLAPNVLQEKLNKWQDLYKEWRGNAEQSSLPSGIIGETYLFHALVNLDGRDFTVLSEHVSTALPDCSSKGLPDAYLTEQGFCLWESAPCGERRALILLAPEACERVATQWLIWCGKDQLAPFARCLLHATKIRYEKAIYLRDLPNLRRQRDEINDALNDLLQHHEQLETCFYLPADELIEAQSRLSRRQADATGLMVSLSHLRELHTTVHIAAHNLQGAIPPAHPSTPTPISPFHTDLADAEWLQTQIGFDREYLQAVHDRAQEAHRLTQRRLEQAKQRTAQRLNELSLLQTALLGALLTALGAIEALQIRVNLPESLHLPIGAFLTALALALPSLLLHWHERYSRQDYLFGMLLGASALWLVSASIAHIRGMTLPLLLTLVIAGIGGMLSYLLLRLVDNWQQHRLKRSGFTSEPSKRNLKPPKSDSEPSKRDLEPSSPDSEGSQSNSEQK